MANRVLNISSNNIHSNNEKYIDISMHSDIFTQGVQYKKTLQSSKIII
jgi:hypothetical protein